MRAMLMMTAVLFPLALAHAEPPASASSADDRAFVRKAATGGMAEVKLGQLAVEKASSPAVKAFGQKMVSDHSKANDELKLIAEKNELPMPATVPVADAQLYDRLARLEGADFDKAYMDAMVEDHDTDVREFKQAAVSSKLDPALKAWAGKTLSVIEQHDRMAHHDMHKLGE